MAFDVEHTGIETIAIGASVVDNTFKELDRFFIGIYNPNDAKFSDRCWEQFWSKNIDTLSELQYDGDLSKSEREKEMIKSFQNFRIKWEQKCKENKFKLVLVSDNNLFDGSLINELIKKYYIPSPEGIPYSVTRNKNHQQEYSPFWETFSQQKGLLSVVDPSFKSDWGLSQRIFELYNVSKPEIIHDHNPANDAYTIAYDQQILFGIRDNKIKLR